MADEPVIKVDEITVNFANAGDPVVGLNGISLDIMPGEFICIIGSSGSGKTTLLNTIAGFVRSTSGRIVVNGREVNGIGSECSIVFQEYAIFPWLTVLGNVEFGLKMEKVQKTRRKRIATRAIEQVGLARFASYYPHQLSGGMKQRVSIARALAVDRPVMLMDEPLGALDAITKRKLQFDIDKLWRETKKTVFYVTHDLHESVLLASRIIVIQAGSVVGDFSIDLDRPRDPYAPEFVKWTKRLSTLLEL